MSKSAVSEPPMEQIRSDRELRESEHLLRAVYESALEAVLIAGDDGAYLSANPAACALFGVSEQEILGHRISDFMAPGFDFEQAWSAFLQAGRSTGEIVIIRRDGTRRDVEFNAVGNILPGRHLSILRDVTERKRVEDALAAANRAKDRFLAMLSHELRTPLTPVLALVSKLERSATKGDDLRRDLGIIRKNVELEARLIDDLLDLTRISRGKVELQCEVTPVHPLLLHALQISCADAVAAGWLTVETDLRAPDPRAWADGPRLTQVFWNILNNSVKFTPQGGTIRVSTDVEAESRTLVIEISDTGRGIDPEVLPRIFDAFEQGRLDTARQFGGLGLGLAISKALLDAHGGTLAARSEGKGQGTAFTVRMALYEGAEREQAPERPVQEEAGAEAARPLSILLVEDHIDTAEAITDLLRDQGHRVVVAASLADGLERAAETPGLDLVISDLGLPDGDGRTLMRELRDRYGLTGIAFSGYGTEEDLQESKEAGFAAHLTKPVTLDALLAEIRRAGGGSGADAHRGTTKPR